MILCLRLQTVVQGISLKYHQGHTTKSRTHKLHQVDYLSRVATNQGEPLESPLATPRAHRYTTNMPQRILQNVGESLGRMVCATYQSALHQRLNHVVAKEVR